MANARSHEEPDVNYYPSPWEYYDLMLAGAPPPPPDIADALKLAKQYQNEWKRSVCTADPQQFSDRCLISRALLKSWGME